MLLYATLPRYWRWHGPIPSFWDLSPAPECGNMTRPASNLTRETPVSHDSVCMTPD